MHSWKLLYKLTCNIQFAAVGSYSHPPLFLISYSHRPLFSISCSPPFPLSPVLHLFPVPTTQSTDSAAPSIELRLKPRQHNYAGCHHL